MLASQHRWSPPTPSFFKGTAMLYALPILSSNRIVNTPSPHNKGWSAEDVEGSNRSLMWESCETRHCAVWTKHRVTVSKQVALYSNHCVTSIMIFKYFSTISAYACSFYSFPFLFQFPIISVRYRESSFFKLQVYTSI
jgi:hypothetical protein